MDRVPLDERPQLDRSADLSERQERLLGCLVLLLLLPVCYVAAGRFVGRLAMAVYTLNALARVCGPAAGTRIFLDNLDYERTGVFVGETDAFAAPRECFENACQAKVFPADAERTALEAVTAWGGVREPRTLCAFLGPPSRLDDWCVIVPEAIADRRPEPCLWAVSVSGGCPGWVDSPLDEAATARRPSPGPTSEAQPSSLAPVNLTECCTGRQPQLWAYLRVLVDATTGEAVSMRCESGLGHPGACR